MKKLFVLLTALSLLLSLAACGSSNDTPPSSTPPSVTEPAEPDTGSTQEPEAPSTDENAPAEDDGTAGEPDAGTQPDVPASGSGSASKPSGGSSSTSKPSGGSTAKPETPAPAPAEKSLSDLMETILSGVDTPGYSTTALTAEQFPAYLFIDQPTGAEAVTADSLIGSIAHSVVLMRLPDGADAAAIAKQVKDKADPRKWICVEAEKTEVKTNGNLVLLVMSDTATTDAITANFAALSA